MFFSTDIFDKKQMTRCLRIEFPSIKKYPVNSCEQFFDDFLNYSLAIFTFSVYTDTVIYFSE